MKNLLHKKNVLVISIFLLCFSTAIFYKTLFHGEIFAWYNDQLFQHNVFYKEWYQIIKESLHNHNLAVYSWNTFLGTDYLASKLMYCVGDFLITPFFIIYNGEINYDLLFCITTIISIVLSGVNAYLFLDKFGIKKNNILIMCSIMYALGGFAMTYTGSYMFHRFYCLLPLLFYFTEKYIQDNKLTGFALIVALLFLQSYELLFSTCFFLVLYFIISYKLNTDLSIYDILKKAVPLIISFFVGIMLVGFVLLPLLLYLKGSSRVASFSFGNFIWNFKQILGFISNMFIPSYNYRSDIPSYMFYSSEHFGSEYGLYITILFILAYVILFKEASKKEYRTFIIGEIIVVLCALIRPLNSIIHGFSEPTFRWAFILEFYHLLVMAYTFDKYEIKHDYLKYLNIIYVCYALLYVIFILAYKLNIKEYGISILINLFSYLIIYLYYFLYKNNKKSFFSALGIVNICVFYGLSIYATYGVYGKGENSYNSEYLDYLIEEDDDMLFRIYFYSEQLWPYSWLNLNDSINNNYLSTTTYDSTYNPVLNDFLNSNGYDSWMIDINDIELLRKLGTKYVISNEEIYSDELEYYTNIDNYLVYRIKNYRHLGYTDSGELNIVEYNRQYFKGVIDVGYQCTLFVGIPYSTGFNVYDQDGNKLETFNLDGGFLGVNIDENVKEISFYYGTPGLKAGILISGIGFIGLVYLIIKDKKSVNVV